MKSLLPMVSLLGKGRCHGHLVFVGRYGDSDIHRQGVLGNYVNKSDNRQTDMFYMHRALAKSNISRYTSDWFVLGGDLVDFAELCSSKAMSRPRNTSNICVPTY